MLLKIAQLASSTSSHKVWRGRIALVAARCAFWGRSRNLLSTLGLLDRSRCGALLILRSLARSSALWACQIALTAGAVLILHFEIARTTLWALCACQIALAAVQCSFWESSRSCAGILTRRSFVENLRRDLATETLCRDLVQKALMDTLYRYLAKKSLTEILPTELL